jgi:hypothetical protein
MIENLFTPTHLLLLLAVALIVLGHKRCRTRARLGDPRLQGVALGARAARRAAGYPAIARGAFSRLAHASSLAQSDRRAALGGKRSPDKEAAPR